MPKWSGGVFNSEILEQLYSPSREDSDSDTTESIFDPRLTPESRTDCYRVFTKWYPTEHSRGSRFRTNRRGRQSTIDQPARVSAYISTASTNLGQHLERVAGAVSITPGSVTAPQSFLLPDATPGGKHSATLVGLTIAARLAPKTSVLDIYTTDKHIQNLLLKKLEDLENKDYLTTPTPSLWRTTVAALRDRQALTRINLDKTPTAEYTATTENAEIALRKPSPDQLDLYIPPHLRIKGLKLASLTQKTAYQAIRRVKIMKPRKYTKKHESLAQSAVRDMTGKMPRASEIWKAIRKPTIFRRPRQFLFYAMHNAYKLDWFFKHIDGAEDRVNCPRCNVPASLEHIVTACIGTHTKNIWTAVGKVFEQAGGKWPHINLGMILACAFDLYEDKALSRLFTILVSEISQQLWKIRCETVIGEKEWPAYPEVENRCTTILNKRLTYDRMMTNRTLYGSRANDIDLVRRTWKGIIVVDERSKEPEDWPKDMAVEVLVGIGDAHLSKLVAEDMPGNNG
ncbi:hypothetical protein V5O48_008369 [Marasmius crinis-equi]|uniref:Reverse transcriptase zinc-binding domain-containing protein n=1 Tax=Marasmius crinis-equi TaxID=585013 RepID=A0ABR3FE45_9AGAR